MPSTKVNSSMASLCLLLLAIGFSTPSSAFMDSRHTLRSVGAQVHHQVDLGAHNTRAQMGTAKFDTRDGSRQTAPHAPSLSDAELRQLDNQLDQLPASGNEVLAVIGAVFMLLVILEFTGTNNSLPAPQEINRTSASRAPSRR